MTNIMSAEKTTLAKALQGVTFDLFERYGMEFNRNHRLFADRLPTDPVVFDCESTGIGDNDEIIGLAVFDVKTGLPLINTLIKPVDPISEASSSFHGILDWQVQSAPSFAEIFPVLDILFRKFRNVLSACTKFDRKMLRQTRMKQIKPLNSLPLEFSSSDYSFKEISSAHPLRPYIRPSSAVHDRRWLRNMYEICETKTGIYGCHGVFKPMFRYVFEILPRKAISV